MKIYPMLQIHNSLTKKKEPFTPLVPGKVKMYVCGITVYDYCHVGHARVMVVFDMGTPTPPPFPPAGADHPPAASAGAGLRRTARARVAGAPWKTRRRVATPSSSACAAI